MRPAALGSHLVKAPPARRPAFPMQISLLLLFQTEKGRGESRGLS